MKKIKLSELPICTSLKGLFTLGTDANNRSVRVSLEFIKSMVDKARTDIQSTIEDAKKIKKGDKGDDGKDGRIALVNHGTNDTTFALTPNVMHVWGEVERLILSLAPNTEQNILAEYCFQFKVPDSKATEFQIQGAKWANGVVPKLKQGKTYQGSVIDSIVMVISD